MFLKLRSTVLAGSLMVLAVISPAVARAPGSEGGKQASRSAAEAAEELGMTCAPVTADDGVTYDKCTGEVPSFDGVPLDADLSLPSSAEGSLPTIVMLHGWGGNKGDWQATSRDGNGADKYHWNNVWFVSQGYAVLNYTARGFRQSCGITDLDPACATGWTHLGDRDHEGRDSQHLLGLLVDAGIADSGRLAATGGSYGGGQSWLLATSLPWKTPSGATIRLSAAVPKYPWTDLLHSLVPNGRASDDVDQSASHERPFGVMKESYVTGLYAIGRAGGEGRYGGNPAETHSFLDGQYALTQAGEPYAPPATEVFARDFRNKSAYYADGYFAAIADGSVEPVPVFSIQGWTDPLFPAVETLQMYRKLKAIDEDYPIYMAFADVGHSYAQNPKGQWVQINTQANQFLNQFVRGQGVGRPTTNVFAFVTKCPKTDDPQEPIAGTDWDRMAAGRVVARGEGSRTTVWAPTNLEDGIATDPIVNGGCRTEPAASNDPLAATWTWAVPGDGFTMLGLPELEIDYSMLGADATTAFKLWDIGPDGTKTLVDRGVYRLSVLEGDATSGKLDLDLFGNAWVFRPGHAIQLQISQADVPFLRPDNLPSTIEWSDAVLSIPIREGFDTELTGSSP